MKRKANLELCLINLLAVVCVRGCMVTKIISARYIQHLVFTCQYELFCDAFAVVIPKFWQANFA